jgi:hypothetical protein
MVAGAGNVTGWTLRQGEVYYVRAAVDVLAAELNFAMPE